MYLSLTKGIEKLNYFLLTFLKFPELQALLDMFTHVLRLSNQFHSSDHK